MKQMLLEAATLVRSKLEEAKVDVAFVVSLKWFKNIEHFPSACCKQTSFVFLYYILKHYNIDPKLLSFMANAEITSGHSHAWAKVGEFHVDLTGDQFGKDKIIVRDSDPWPNIYSRGCEYSFNVDILLENIKATLERFYNYICEGTWIVPFKGRNFSEAYDQNFLWQKGPIYVMDNHRAALWCWLQEIDLKCKHSILHIDKHTDTLQSRLNQWLDNLPKSWELTIEEYLEHKYKAEMAIDYAPIFRWDNYLSIYFAKFGSAIESCYFATHEDGDTPNYPRVCKFDFWNLPYCFSDCLDEKNSPWIVNIDLDYFFWRDYERFDVIVTEEYLSACFKPLKKKINNGTVKVTTIALTPTEEFTGGWKNSEKLAKRVLAHLGIDFHLPEHS